MTFPETTCVVLGCGRTVRRSTDGTWAYNRCDDHVSALQSAFGSPVSASLRAPLGRRADPEAEGLPQPSGGG